MPTIPDSPPDSGLPNGPSRSAPSGNIGRSQAGLRQLLGAAGLLGGAAVVAVLMLLDAGRWWRLMALLPFWVGVLGLLQAKEKT